LRDDTSIRVGITNPKSCWASAGLHTGDMITGINGQPIHTRQEFQTALGSLHIGGTAIVDVRKGTATIPRKVMIRGYTKPVITITEDPAATPKQRRLLRQWLDVQTPLF
jgi:PDZ domain-containing secreted protein